MKTALPGFLALASMLAATSASAQETTPGVVRGDRVLTDEDSRQTTTNERPPLALFPASPEDSLIDPRMARSWSTAPARSFVATTFDVGFVYLRPRVSLGYGKPFSSWVGIDVNALAQTSGLGGYAGLRLEIPYVDLRMGPRLFRAFTRTYLPVKDSYFRLDVETNSGKPAVTVAYEAEVDASIPAGPGNILFRGSATYLTGPADDEAAFEETLHVIVRPPFVWRARGGYAFRLGSHEQHSIGILADHLDVPKRNDSLTVRVGPSIRFTLSRRVELRGIFVVSVKSPDRIGLVGGDFGELGVRYRWASE